MIESITPGVNCAITSYIEFCIESSSSVTIRKTIFVTQAAFFRRLM